MSRFRPTPEIAALVFAEMRPNTTVDDDGKVRKIGRSLKRGKFERRIIAQKKIGGVEYAFHATKGWRRRPIDWGYDWEARPFDV
jgi:hypothetical protein